LAQESKEKDLIEIKTKSVKIPNETKAIGDKVTIKDGTTVLMEVENEGSAGSILLPPLSSITTSTDNKLYNLGGTLNWNGSALGTGGSSLWTQNGSDIYYNLGNVGIGTSSPVWELEVVNPTAGDGAESGVTANDAGGAIAAYSSTLPSPFEHFAGRVSLFSNALTMGLDLRADGSVGDIRFYTGGPFTLNERMRIAANGFVGIGTTDAQWQLHIQNPNEGHVNIMTEDNDGTWGTFGVNDGGNYAALSQGQGSSEYWDTIVLKYGKVGIGTTNPLSKLSVGGTGYNNATIYAEYSGSSGHAGYFEGKVSVTGNLYKGGGSFKIDHPLDPTNKNLYHSFVESPDMMNIYNGNVVTDITGNASVDLPEWFEALNRDFRYQLTVIGEFAQAIVSRKINKNG